MNLNRRSFLSLMSAGLLSTFAPPLLAAPSQNMTYRPIPASGEKIPVIGMGTWRTFNVGSDPSLRAKRAEVLKTFFELGGTMVDSSPMYGSAEEVMGWAMDRLEYDNALFSATKVWTSGREDGIREMAQSQSLWNVNRFDLMQIHNLLDWETHLPTLQEMKEKGTVRYIGITTSHGRRHRDMETVMKKYPLDFVQLTYNVLDREVEERLLPLAQDRGIGVIVNRPFQRDALFDHIGKAPLPGWASEINCAHWAQLLLKFTLSHPAVTCVIPATTQVAHMKENMACANGPLLDQTMYKNIIDYVESL